MSEASEGVRFADTIQVVRQGWGAPGVAVFIDGKPFLFLTDKVEIGEVSRNGTPTVTLTVPANRVLLVDDVLSREKRDQQEGEKLAAEAARLAEGADGGESGG